MHVQGGVKSSLPCWGSSSSTSMLHGLVKAGVEIYTPASFPETPRTERPLTSPPPRMVGGYATRKLAWERSDPAMLAVRPWSRPSSYPERLRLVLGLVSAEVDRPPGGGCGQALSGGRYHGRDEGGCREGLWFQKGPTSRCESCLLLVLEATTPPLIEISRSVWSRVIGGWMTDKGTRVPREQNIVRICSWTKVSGELEIQSRFLRKVNQWKWRAA